MLAKRPPPEKPVENLAPLAIRTPRLWERHPSHVRVVPLEPPGVDPHPGLAARAADEHAGVLVVLVRRVPLRKV